MLDVKFELKLKYFYNTLVELHALQLYKIKIKSAKVKTTKAINTASIFK